MRRLAFSLIFVVLTALLGFGWFINQVYFLTDNSTGNSSESVELYSRFIKDISSLIENDPDTLTFIESWNKSGNFEINLVPAEDFPLPPELLESFNLGETLILQSQGILSLHHKLSERNEVLSISLPENLSETANSKLSLLLTLSFYFGIVVIVLLWLSPLIRQLMRLRSSAIQYGLGHFDTRIRISSFSYIREIENEFNQMADKIERLIKDNKLLSRAVSHDLKTPLARLRFGIETLDETETPSSRKKYTERLVQDLDDMEALVNRLLEFARLDQAQVSLNKEAVNILSFSQQLSAKIENSEVTIDYEYDDKASEVLADQHYLSMLLNNILQNAVIHAKSRVHVSIKNAKNESLLVLSIDDDGPGISDQDKVNVLKPFWRGANQNTARAKQKGHGMGLAIAQRIAEWHGIDLEILDSGDLGGASFKLTFTTLS